MPTTPSFDQANSYVVVARSSSPSHTFSTSPLTLASNMDALALLDAFRENKAIAPITPSTTLVDRTQKSPRVKENT
ncbi:hypothetical protein J1N35_019233 [Gossypium stocksii]|uniref:Uncharacterized protein n=1 Tax=Gossypium stocksii TaxID=47602 RepID=A0A9D4A7W6_9ROSI|nr:hypothetical protein J1N35_019233 [Gossypium stocksii]